MTSTDAARRWYALPHPSTVRLEGGAWRPDTVQVIVADECLAAEAARLQRELAALGIPPGTGSRILLRSTEAAITSSDAASTPGGAVASDEAYAIDVGDDIDIRVPSATGGFRATRQLLHNLRAQGCVPRGSVAGTPAVRERGVHLDAARKHYPAEWIIALLHAAADVGINVLQWHFSENEGFRLESATFPEIVSAGHITRADAVRILDVARDLHVEVIPSLDMPGHLRQVLAQHPHLRLPPGRDRADAAIAGTDHALDITREQAVAFAERLIDDVAPVFAGCSRWHLGGDEFVDFARIDDYPALRDAAHVRYGAEASGFDLLTAFVNRIAAHLRGLGFRARAWNDGMLRGSVVRLDAGIELTWWTNWHRQMRPLADAVAAGHPLVNVNDGLFYYVLGEHAGYRYPTAERIWAADWHPGLFPVLPGGGRQEIPHPYPDSLRGSCFAIWSDEPGAQTVAEVADGIRAPLRAMAERAWNGGSALTLAEFERADAAIGLPEGASPPG